MVAAAPETTPPSPRGLRHLWRWATGQEASRWRFPPLLLALLAIALALRLYGISWDQGSLFHPDERSIYMRVDCMYRVLTKAPGYGDCTRDAPFQQTQPGFPSPTEFLDARKSPLNPHWFPLGTLILYVLLAVKFALAPIMTTDLQDLAMAGRTLAALADVATIGMAYAMGARLYGRGAGLLAAALITFAAIHIQISHFYRPEPFYNLFLLVAFWQMLNVLERHRVRDSAWLGVFIGLTFATKASALPILLPVAAAYGYLWMRRPRVEAQGPSAGSGQALAPLHRLSSPLVGEGQDPQGVAHQGEPGQAREALALRVLLTGVTALAVYLLATPYALLSFPELLEWDLRELDIVRRAGIVPYTVQYIGAPRLVYELQQTTLWGLGIPLGVLAWGGFLAALALNLWRPRLPQVLLLLWAVPLLFTIAAVQVKFLRYTFPLVPVFILLGSGLAVQAIAWLQKHSRLASRAAIAGVALVVAATVFYALAFESIYTHPHTAVQASRWLNANAPPGAEILTDNHWDEGIPDLGRYQVTQLPMFDGDSAAKMDSLARNLSRADYLVFYSNRTYGAIARAVERYPYSSAYYLALFRGDLGFQLAASFSSYPSLLGVAFADDPFTRAGLPAPQGLREQQGAAIWLDLGYADNDVITYDRPLTLVFQNTARWNKDQLLPLLLQPRAPGDRAPQQPLMLTPQELAVQQSGGTWRDLFHPSSLANRLPVLAWLLLVETAFLAAWPLAFAVFRGLHDRGYLLAKALALLLLAYIPWLLAALKLLPFGRPSIFLGLLAVAAASAFILARNSGEAQRFLRARWRGLLFQEALFLAAFAAFLLVRWANPDLWHPFRGGEKPMDLAYLTAVVRSSTVPPYDPWFAGGYLNYYYFGQFIVATLVKATGILPEIAYNLAVPLLFALTVGGAFSVAYNLTHVLRDARTQGKGPGWGPAAAGVAAALMVAVLGNMGGVIQLVRTVWYGWLATARPPGDGFHIWFWVSAHEMMPGQISITEFPLWTFLFADLHAHLIAIPFGVLAIGLALNLVGIGTYGQAGRRTYGQSGRRAVGQWLRGMGRLALPLGFLALAVGALAAINTWDYPTYLLLGAAAVAIAVWSAHRGRRAGGEASEAPTPASHPSEADPGVREGGPPPRHGPLLAHAWTWAVGGILLLATLSFLLFLPYHARNIAYDAGVHTSAQQTNLLHYLALHALFLFILVSFLLYEGRGPIRGWLRGVRRPPLPPPPWDAPQAAVRQGGGRPLLVGLGLLALLTAYLLAAGYATLAVLFLLAVATVLLAARIAAWPGQDAPHRLFLLSLILLALGIGIGVDLVTINNDIDRMNTVFKFYLQAWVLFGLASGVALWRLLAAMRFSWRGLLGAKENWFGILFVLLMAPAVAHTAVALGVVYSAVAPGEAPKWSEGFTLARQGWVLYLPAGLAVLGYVASAVAPSWHRPAWGKGIWLGVLLLLLAGATGYLVPALRVRLAERFSTAFQGLDGAEYMRSVTYNDANGPIDLRWDWEGIQWLRAKVDGSPVVAEGNTDPHNYRWGSRVSIYTGLPTIVGWGWHQTQQRMGEQAEVAARLKDVRALFTTRDVALALDILDRYNVRYIYVGQLERLYYPAEGLAKFDNMAGQGVTLVYPNPGVKIYEVRRE